jgi:hypothetical protein
MPNILDPNFQAPDIRPSEIGVESAAAAGRRVGVYGAQIAASKEQEGRDVGQSVKAVGDAAYQQGEHMEISAGTNHGANLIATLNESWNQTAKNADPNDPTTAKKWREETLEPALDQFSRGFITQGGQDWADKFVSQYREHAVVKTAADMSSMAADAVHVNAVKTINGLSAAAFSDPSTSNFARDTLAHSLDGVIGSSPTLSATDAAKVRTELTEKGEEQIVKSAVMGAIVKGGDWQSIASDPKNAPYINGPEIKQFEAQQKYYQRGEAVAAKQEILLNKQIAETNAHGAINDSWAKNVKVDDQTGRVTIDPQFIRDMVALPLKNPNAPDAADKARTYVDWAESQQKPPPRADNPAAIDGLMKTISDPAVSLDDAKIAITKADIQKGVTPETRGQLIQLATDMRNLNNPLLTKTMEAAKDIVEPKYGGHSTDPGAFAKFYYDFIHNQYLPAKVSGTLPPDALDMSQPSSMISKALAAARPGVGAAVGANGGVAPPLPVYTAPTKPAAPAAPAVGETRGGYTYQGGDPADPKSWKPGA